MSFFDKTLIVSAIGVFFLLIRELNKNKKETEKFKENLKKRDSD